MQNNSDEERLKVYLAWGEISRKWVAVMDTKAGFLSALNVAILGFIWTGAKIAEAATVPKAIFLLATFVSLISLAFALFVVLPRGSITKIFDGNSRYTNGFRPLSFYGYVATNYPKGEEVQFFQDAQSMDGVALCKEALEQHYTISHGLQIKSKWLVCAGKLLMITIFLTVAALVAKEVC